MLWNTPLDDLCLEGYDGCTISVIVLGYGLAPWWLKRGVWWLNGCIMIYFT